MNHLGGSGALAYLLWTRPEGGAVGFVNPAGGDYRLLPTSPYYNGGTDGAHVGTDFDALLSSTAGVVDGRPMAYVADAARRTAG